MAQPPRKKWTVRLCWRNLEYAEMFTSALVRTILQTGPQCEYHPPLCQDCPYLVGQSIWESLSLYGHHVVPHSRTPGGLPSPAASCSVRCGRIEHWTWEYRPSQMSLVVLGYLTWQDLVVGSVILQSAAWWLMVVRCNWLINKRIN